MLTPLTSLIDFEQKIKEEPLYKRLVIYYYKAAHPYSDASFVEEVVAFDWFYKKIKNFINPSHTYEDFRQSVCLSDCSVFVEFLNEQIPKVEKEEIEKKKCNKKISFSYISPASPKPGDMCEYGWFDESFEIEISDAMSRFNITRERALLRLLYKDNLEEEEEA